jgi:metallo-beta-lactamase family protein
MSNPTIQFLGAAETVTGSRFLVTYGDVRVLVDCGMFQGEPDISAHNDEKFPIQESSINALVLTHAHLDHCGYIPALVKNGFTGSIFSTHYTQVIAEVVLRDSAHLQMQKAKYAEPELKAMVNAAALYNEVDVERAMKQFKAVEIHQRIEILPEVFITFYTSGHILGASFVVLEIGGKSLLFTGDLGRGSHPFLNGPDLPPATKIDVVVTESTYGDREHETPITDFADALNQAIARGGSILIPAFAVDRTEEILFELRRLFEARLVKSVPVYIDSPMAEKVLVYYKEAIEEGRIDIQPEIAAQFKGIDPFDPGKFRIMTTVDESKLLNDMSEQSIIVSASGMATGGRVTYHLESMLPEPTNTIILVGFQAKGSRGLQLQQGTEKLRIHGNWVPVLATIADVQSFSVHADQREIVGWLSHIDHPTQAFIVHGERESQEAIAAKLTSELGWKAIIPELSKIYEIE